MATPVRASAHEAAYGPSGVGEVVVDIGGDVGAVIVYTGRELDGGEIEVRAVGTPWEGTHVGVRERRLANGSCWAALLAPLWGGAYEARLKGQAHSSVLRFEVVPGVVSSLIWPIS
ncbi:MAG TPA: hypothetical protein VK425_06290 [Acidimicrobiales bacterium]|nr:hypothetical protein [Acidimicrobiales bacterium]